MKGKFLNLLIIIILLLIISVGGFLIYQYVTFDSFTALFVLNGADGLSEDSITCKFSLKGCIIEMPEIIKTNGNIEGFNLNSNDTIARYRVGDSVLIDDDTNFYAITYKEKSLNIDSSDVDYIDNKNASCMIHNEEKSCKIKLPFFNKKGYINLGYSTTKSNSNPALYEYFVNEEYEVNENVDTIYPIYDSDRAGASKEVYDVTYDGIIHTDVLEYDKSCSSSTLSTFKKYFDEINLKAPYLFTNSKITLLSSSYFNNIWSRLSLIENTLGLTYRSDVYNPTKMSVIDIKYNYSGFNSSNIYAENYHTLVHEMVHSWDSYYPFLVKGVNPDTIDSSNSSIHKRGYYNNYENGSISSQSDITSLFNKYHTKYKTQCLRSLPTEEISNYGFCNNTDEFVAEIFSIYYLKYIVPTGKYANNSYPDDIKKAVEKYICIAKNNYHNKGCS